MFKMCLRKLRFSLVLQILPSFRRGIALIMRYKSGLRHRFHRERNVVFGRRISVALTKCLYMNEWCRMAAFAGLKGISRYYAQLWRILPL